jgi:aminoglycoside phosphotransferase (APT) family kinase protein
VIEEQVRSLVAATFGVAPLRASRMTFGQNSVTFAVTLPERDIIVRTNTRPAVFAHTERNLAILGGLGLPVPRLLAADHSLAHYPFAYMILAKIPGRDLRYELPTMSALQMTRLAEQIVGYQCRVTTLPQGNGFGWAAIGEPGRFATWWELIQAELASRRAEAGTCAIAGLIGRLERAIDGCSPYLRSVPPTCFLDDVTTKNVIMQGGELQGLIDFDVVCYGDPLFQVALTAVAILCDVGPETMFYADELRRLRSLTGEQERATALYAALFGLEFILRLRDTQSPAWNRRMVEAIMHWLSLAERPAC